jgi:hypothetical protein
LDPSPTDVRFGSKADICGAQSHVRFAPNSDRKSGFPHKVMSALPPKADIDRHLSNVCEGCQEQTLVSYLPFAFSLCSMANCLCSTPNMVDQAPNTTVTRSVVYETVTMYIPQ